MDKDMEELSLQVEEEDPSASDVNVYITVDRATLEKLQKKDQKRSGGNASMGTLFKDCMEELNLESDFVSCFTKKGFLRMVEGILALILLLISAISYPGDFGWGNQIYFIVVNSLNLFASLMLLTYQCLAGNFSSFTALQKVMCFLVEFLLFILQLVSFILVIAVGRGSAGVVIFIILTFVQCGCLIVSLINSSQEVSEKKVQSLTNSKKERLRRRKLGKKKYKRLHHSGF